MIIAVIPAMFIFSNGRFTNNRIKLSNAMLKKRTKYIFVNKHQMRDLKELRKLMTIYSEKEAERNLAFDDRSKKQCSLTEI